MPKTGMDREVYEGAESGCVGMLKRFNNWKHEKTATGNNVLHIHVGRPLHQSHPRGAVTEQNTSTCFIRYVLDETSEDSALLQRNDKGDTPLHFAARFGNTGAVQEFLTRSQVLSAGLLSIANSRMDTALHDATRAAHTDIVVLLVEAAGGNALHHDIPNYLCETPLFLAAESGCSESFAAIFERTSLTASALQHKGPCGQTVLHVAVLCGNKGIIDRILQMDTSSLLIRIKNDQGQTPLHCCAAQNVKKYCTILKDLLDHDDKYSSAAYIQDNQGRTPLHIATLNLNFSGAEMLICCYPDCIEMVDSKGQNVVHYAASSGCLNTFEQFLRKAPKCDRLINEKDNDGNTPLHLLVATTPTLPIHGCFFKLPYFLLQHKNLNVRAFNDKNLTAGDIIAANDTLHHLAAPTQTSKMLPKGRRIHDVVNVGTGKIQERINHLRKVGETRLVVAALIATVSFTAGFTLPGGFDQSPGKDTGLAVLVKKASFIAFLVSDTIAFTMSSLAVICYFSITNQNDLVRVERLSIKAHLMNSISLGALMIAFVSGVYAVVSQSPALAFTIIAISLFYFLFYIFLMVGCWKTMWAFITRNTAIYGHVLTIGSSPYKYHVSVLDGHHF